LNKSLANICVGRVMHFCVYCNISLLTCTKSL